MFSPYENFLIVFIAPDDVPQSSISAYHCEL